MGSSAPQFNADFGEAARAVRDKGYRGLKFDPFESSGRDPDHALGLIEAVVGAVDLPVTLKMRLGWDDDSRNAAEIARRAEAAGVRTWARGSSTSTWAAPRRR